MESEQRIIIDKLITAFETYALGDMKTVAEQKDAYRCLYSRQLFY